MCTGFMEGKVDISQLIISKTLKAEYANPTQIAHKYWRIRWEREIQVINHNRMTVFHIVIWMHVI